MSAIDIAGVSHSYQARVALRDVTFQVVSGEIFGLLGPNGGGKSTLLKLLSTLLPLQTGEISLCGHSVRTQADAVRRSIAVTFQNPSLDIKLTVRENLTHQGHLYGLSGLELSQRIERVLTQLNLADRGSEYAEKLSGGLKRRVELAKCLLHQPQVLLLDEPSTGLDPGARNDLWTTLGDLRAQTQTTILVTTHLMEEADRCDRLGILDEGQLIALGTPDELRSSVGGDSLTIDPVNPDQLEHHLQSAGLQPRRLGNQLRIENVYGTDLITQLASDFPGEFRSLTLGKPTLEDTFIRLTGRRLGDESSG